MTTISQLDQAVTEAQGALDELIEAIRKSQDDTRERYGENYDPAKAMLDIYRQVNKFPNKLRTVMLGTALMRLAQPHPFTEIADLDFDFDPEETEK
jgi:hypothetical protein